MKLRGVHVREFKSVWDSNPFEVDRVACLVGKNEAGKTAILQALYRLNPIVASDGNFDVTDDYPRSEVENYQQDIETKRRMHAKVIEATFALDEAELNAIKEKFGSNVLSKPEIVLSKSYSKSANGCYLYVSVPVVEATLAKNLVESFDLPSDIKGQALKQLTLELLGKYLAATLDMFEAAFKSANALLPV
ncbi:MAG: hypothetical protein HY067_02430 [Betaproteobacteria bacterium]|nr:hypothetical protein [Betaproteobacteria bacterium]